MCKGGTSVVPSRSISGSLIDILQSRGEFPPSRNVLQQALSTCESQVVYEETTPQDSDKRLNETGHYFDDLSAQRCLFSLTNTSKMEFVVQFE